MNIEEYISVTLGLMTAYHVPIRCTYDPTYNYDDFFINGNVRDGPRRIAIEFLETDGFTSISGKKYTYPGHPTLAWDRYRIKVPKRLLRAGRADDAIVHECVHFLQYTTEEEEANYVAYDAVAPNWPQYLCQRVELEAHFIQIAYLFADRMPYVESRMDRVGRDAVLTTLRLCREGQQVSQALRMVIDCKVCGLI